MFKYLDTKTFQKKYKNQMLAGKQELFDYVEEIFSLLIQM